VLDQVMRKLPDCEDVDEVEEELERSDDSLRPRGPRNGDPHREDRMALGLARLR
jgi:hypothetical protein